MSALTSRLDAKLIEDAAKALIKYERKQEQASESRKLIEERPKWVLLQVCFVAPINFFDKTYSIQYIAGSTSKGD